MTNRHSYTPSLSEANKEAADIINSDRQQRRVASITSTTTTPSTTASSKQPETEGRRGKNRSSATRTTESSVERKLAKEVEFWDSNYQSGGNKDLEVDRAELTVSQEPFVRTTRTSQSSHSSNTSSGRRSPFTRRSSLSTSSTGSRRFKMRKVNSTGSNGKGGGSNGNKESGLEETMTGKAQVLGATNSGIKRTATSGSTEGRRNRGGNRSNHSQSTSSTLRRAVTDTGMSRSKHEVSPTTRSNNKLTSQFMRKGVPTKGFPTHATAISTTATINNSTLLAEHSDLSDPDDDDDDDDDNDHQDDPLSLTSTTAAIVSFGTMPRADRTGRLKSVNIDDSRRDSGGFLQNSIRNFLGRRSLSEQETNSQTGSTLLAGLGDKYQVDQSVNLMDMESAERQMQKRQKKQQRKSFKDIFFGDEMQFDDVGMDDNSHASFKPRRSVMIQHQSKPPPPWTKWCTAIIVSLVLLGIVGLLVPLVVQGSVGGGNNNSEAVTTPAPTALTTTLLTPTETPASTSTTETEEEEEMLSVGASESSVIPPAEQAASLSQEQKEQLDNKLEPEQQQESTTTAQVVVEEGEGKPPEDLSIAKNELWDDLVGLITRKGVTPQGDFDDPTTSAYKALDWMIEYDKSNDLSIISSDTESNLLETYALAVLYFATHPSIGANTRPIVKSFSLKTNHGNNENENEDSAAATETEETESSLLLEELQHDWIHQSKPKCHWKGVRCSHLHNVVKLNVTRSHLAGTLPAELNALQHLIEVDLSHNNIGGTLPSTWPTGLTHMQKVDLSHNRLVGAVPDTWKELWLDNNVVVELSQNEQLDASSGG
ncbi:receptor-like protein [Seminavis robusta]|uniref:Receptor-like protein n=1 Tax=Seminavis robusta TaxID=568900 RepID=A0A9N8F4D7_9STRA|nr:receptor-like protein [Seminavis robusta]|eukprot:Sro3407_g347680.1 receptor-like protein (822) ;mRNA; r:3457-6146